jgi:hypothetical protein
MKRPVSDKAGRFIFSRAVVTTDKLTYYVARDSSGSDLDTPLVTRSGMAAFECGMWEGSGMHSGYVRFPIGEITGIAVSDGTLNYPVEAFFANAPRAEVEAGLRRLGFPIDRVPSPYTCLVIETGEHRVLVDTGAGALGQMADSVFPGIDHSTTHTGGLVASLAAAGIAPSAIDSVVITHAHPDHIGDVLREDGTLTFDDARYVVGREEWEFWFSDEKTAQVPRISLAWRARLSARCGIA